VYYYPNHGCILDTWPQSGWGSMKQNP
jgi:hypothetical protein